MRDLTSKSEFGRSGWRICAAIAATVALVFCAAGSSLRAQSEQDSRTEFDAASIKPHPPSGAPGSHLHVSGGMFSYTGSQATTHALIAFAYDLKDSQISGEPGWVMSDAYDVNATLDDSRTPDFLKLSIAEQTAQFRLMTQRLLEDRYHLKIVHATKDLPIYELAVAKNGPKLKPPSPDSLEKGRGIDGESSGGQNTEVGTDASMAQLARALSRQPEVQGEVIVDKTGLPGGYDFTLKWTRERPGDATVDNGLPRDASAPPLFDALEEQLGLKLESKKGPVDTIVILHIEKPSEN
jgi:uncharacterized protein (TIGR03435 family)